MTVAFRHSWIQKLKWCHTVLWILFFSTTSDEPSLHVVENMAANSPNFLSALVSNSNESCSQCHIFIPGKTGPPSLGHVYHDPLDGPLWWIIHFYPRKDDKKRPERWGETLTKEEGVDSEHFQTKYFHASRAHPCWVLEIFKTIFKYINKTKNPKQNWFDSSKSL